MLICDMRRCAVYVRVSRKRDQSPALQLDALRALCAQRGWATTEYVDHGVSGARASRPDLDRLMRDVHAGKVDVVAVWKFDRFARSTQHLVTALNDFRSRSVEFISVQDGIDTSTAAGRMVFGVIAALAEFERELIVERVHAIRSQITSDLLGEAGKRFESFARPLVEGMVRR